MVAEHYSPLRWSSVGNIGGEKQKERKTQFMDQNESVGSKPVPSNILFFLLVLFICLPWEFAGEFLISVVIYTYVYMLYNMQYKIIHYVFALVSSLSSISRSREGD